MVNKLPNRVEVDTLLMPDEVLHAINSYCHDKYNRVPKSFRLSIALYDITWEEQ